jgi:hypothetical protein
LLPFRRGNKKAQRKKKPTGLLPYNKAVTAPNDRNKSPNRILNVQPEKNVHLLWPTTEPQKDIDLGPQTKYILEQLKEGGGGGHVVQPE